MPEIVQTIVFFAVPAFTSWVVSDILEQQAWFHKLTSQNKNLAWLAATVVLGFALYLLLQGATPDVINKLTAWAALLSQMVTSYTSGTYYHDKLDNTTASTTSGNG